MTEQATALQNKERYHFEDLVAIMKLLRSEDGCPWDREQTHQSIRKNLLEETYEVAEAIDQEDSRLLCEELGDLLLQVVFHAQMEAEAGRFTMDDVSEGICRKLIHRHPHIFADVKAESSEQVLANWESIKNLEKQRNDLEQVLRAVPATLPALMRAQKIVGKAAKRGALTVDSTAAAERIRQAAEEFSSEQRDPKQVVANLLFETILLAGALGVDAEEVLSQKCDTIIYKLTQK
ncbi:MAG: nucleoside triphosphate pyrophosphohydrolase [Eubacteriales bacterium]